VPRNNSLSDGVLYRICQRGYALDHEAALGVLFSFWATVKQVFAGEWGLPSKKCRLLHGAGVICLGLLMDSIADRHRSKGFPTKMQLVRDLTAIVPVCRWSKGHWDFGPGQQLKWNELQSTSSSIRLLSNYLLVQYKALVWNKASTRALAVH